MAWHGCRHWQQGASLWLVCASEDQTRSSGRDNLHFIQCSNGAGLYRLLIIGDVKGSFWAHFGVITDHITCYAMTVPTRNQTARTTARVLFDNFFAHYGFPASSHSDKVQNFESKVIKHLCKVAGIKKTRTTAYPSMGNGQTEPFNQPLLRMLGTLEPSKKSDWKSYVLPLVHAYECKQAWHNRVLSLLSYV